MPHRGTTPPRARTIRAGRIAVLVATMGTILVVVTAPPAAACSCASPNVTEQLDRADVVFSGVVVATTGPDRPGLGSGPIDLTFRVERAYKGTVHAEPVVQATVGGAGCGLDPPIAGRYLMFATNESRGLVDAGLCGGTRPLSGDVPQELGPGMPVSVDEAQPPTEPSGSGDAEAAATPNDGPVASSDRVIVGTVVAVSVVVVGGLLIMARGHRRRLASPVTD